RSRYRGSLYETRSLRRARTKFSKIYPNSLGLTFRRRLTLLRALVPRSLAVGGVAGIFRNLSSNGVKDGEIRRRSVCGNARSSVRQADIRHCRRQSERPDRLASAPG